MRRREAGPASGTRRRPLMIQRARNQWGTPWRRSTRFRRVFGSQRAPQAETGFSRQVETEPGGPAQEPVPAGDVGGHAGTGALLRAIRVEIPRPDQVAELARLAERATAAVQSHAAHPRARIQSPAHVLCQAEHETAAHLEDAAACRRGDGVAAVADPISDASPDQARPQYHEAWREMVGASSAPARTCRAYGATSLTCAPLHGRCR